MICKNQMRAWESKDLNPTGKRSTVFKEEESNGVPRIMDCGQCSECRQQKKAEWATRMVHESSMHSQNTFFTNTYNDENLPKDGQLVVEHAQSFMKLLRQKIYPQKISFFNGAEYGEKSWRPHFHFIIFGYDPKDKIQCGLSKDKPIYQSEMINKIWGKGNVIIGEVNRDTCAYVANYTCKKITGEKAKEHYKRVKKINADTGEILETINLRPEFSTMSKRPAIGYTWYQKWKTDIYPSDNLVIKNAKGKYKSVPIPKYYDKLKKEEDPEGFNIILINRLKKQLTEQGIRENHPVAKERKLHWKKMAHKPYLRDMQ